jgi:RNA polymerase sigma-70 factor (ECF subfamily)
MAGSRPEPETRPSLLVRLRDAHDADAWATFVAVYGPLVYAQARRGGLGHEDAEDVTQRVFARVAAAVRTFEYRPDRGRFRAWLGTVVRNEVRRHHRAAAGDGAVAAADLLDTVAAPAEDTEWAAAFNAHVLRAALDRSRPHFEPATWAAFEAVWMAGRPAPEVAAELGQPVTRVYVAKSRVLKRLWETVRELSDDLPVPEPG